MQLSNHQPCDVCNVGHEVSADSARDFSESAEVDHAGIGARPGNDHFGLMLLRQVFHLVIVNELAFLMEAVRNDLEEIAGKIRGAPVGQMPPVGEIHAQDGIPGL